MSTMHALRPIICFLCLACCVGGPTAAADDLTAIRTAVRTNQYDKALERAEAMPSTDPQYAKLAGILHRAGNQAAEQNHFAPAAEFYQLLLTRFPDSRYASQTRANLVTVYSGLRRLEDCIRQSQENLSLEPDSPHAEYWEFLIAQSAFRLWKFEEAERGLTAFLEKYPTGRLAGAAQGYLDDIDPQWDINPNGVVAYTGKYENDIRFQAVLEELPKRLDESFALLKARTGLDLAPHTHILFVFEDAHRDPKGGLIAVTRVIGMDNKPTTVVRFYSEHVVAEPETYTTTLTHEIKHAGFIGLMGHPYDSLPKWVREGLAVYASDEHIMRLHRVLLNQIIAGKDPMEVLDGIDDPIHDLVDYLEDGLAFEWLEHLQEGNVKRFCGHLMLGEAYRVAMAEVSGMPYSEALAAINVYCKRRVEGALGAGYTEWIPLRNSCIRALNNGPNATKQWLESGGRQEMETWLNTHPGHLIEPFARFCLARSLITAGEYGDGRALLQKILKEDSRRSSLEDDAMLWLSISYQKEGDLEAAGDVMGALLRDYSYSHSARRIGGRLQPAGPVTE